MNNLDNMRKFISEKCNKVDIFYVVLDEHYVQNLENIKKVFDALPVKYVLNKTSTGYYLTEHNYKLFSELNVVKIDYGDMFTNIDIPNKNVCIICLSDNEKLKEYLRETCYETCSLFYNN